MGFVNKSNNKKIYAYLTQNGKVKILTGETIDFQVKYFSLHDNDVNYYISSKKSNNIYNTLPSGFIPDITGDDNICSPNILNTVLKDALTTPIIVLTPEYVIQPNKISVNEGEKITYTITTQNITDNILYWSYNGTTSSADFIEGISAGSMNPISLITNTSTPSIKSASFSLNVRNDVSTEGAENITVYLKNAAGDTLATAAQVIINDTSLTVPPLPPLQGGIIQTCLDNGTDKLKIQIISAVGGAGGPYKWKAVPVDSNGNLVIMYDPNIYTFKQTNETYDFPTTYGNNNVYYKIYLIDSQGNQGLINTTTTTCAVSVGDLILNVAPATFATGNVGGIGNSNGQTVITTGEVTFPLTLLLTRSDGSAITTNDLNFTFSIIKSEGNSNTMDLTYDLYNQQTGYAPLSTPIIYNFSDAIASPSNTIYTKRITLRVARNSNSLLKPIGGTFPTPQQRFYTFKIKVTNSSLIVNDTLTLTTSTYEW
jgi:hypothetical protein